MQDQLDGRAELSAVSQAYLTRLSQIADSGERRIYAVLDGALFGNLTGDLSAAGLCHRPLYRQAGPDAAIMLGGPWLVSLSLSPAVPPAPDGLIETAEPSDEELQALAAKLSDAMADAVARGDESGGGVLPADEIDLPRQVKSRIEALLKLVADKPAVVFWVGDRSLSEETIHRHLRGINRIILPLERDALAGLSGSVSGEAGDISLAADDAQEEASFALDLEEGRGRSEIVIFRHADPNVMMQVLPALSPEQVVRLIGPAEEIYFAPAEVWGGSIKRAHRPVDVVAQGGMLRLTPENIEVISASRMLAARRRRVGAFQRSAPHLLQGMEEREALIFMERYETQARIYGLKTERGFFQWTYLMSASNGRFIEAPDIRQNLKGSNPDARLDEMMRLMANAAKERGRA
ncbi:hypothetical protein O8B93_25685 [Agrobacterium rhizogenes]|uniref:hypothetical protein n=1 Tax=Rhizobium rhizogenes TaxID=359 RepID=UPI0022B65520|nr:hypothetical protein [Rhizobium rhizogenes]MCZ7450969.1 hypothetical protein [Rhizobium rhizogenes]